MNRSWTKGLVGGRAAIGSVALLVVAAAALLPGTSARAATSPLPASVDWAQGLSFGPVGNVGAGAVADCAVAAVADIEQVLLRRPEPADPAPYLAAYGALARASGETPGPTAGLRPSDVLATWRTRGIAGTHANTRRLAALDVATVERALSVGPLYSVLDLPPPASTAATWVDAHGVALTAWSASSAPAGYTARGPHVVAVVGYDPVGVLVATWGFVQPITWAEWHVLATVAWAVLPA